MKKLIILISAMLALSASACDWGKGLVSPVKASIPAQREVDVPFDYRDCAAPASVSFTVVAQKSQSSFSVRVLDVVTGIEYVLDPTLPIGDIYSFPPLPAPGHFYFVELMNGSRGKITANVYAQ